MTTEYQLNKIAEYFNGREEASMPLADVLAAIGVERMELRDGALAAAMAARGISFEDGRLYSPKAAAAVEPASADYKPFIAAALEIIDMATAPIPAAEMVGATGIAASAIPRGGFSHHLTAAGIHYIPGAGYWKAPQFVGDDGEFFYAPPKAKKVRIMLECFKLHGWPLAGEDVERLTSGAVASRFVTLHAAKAGGSAVIKGIGNALFVPAGAMETPERPVPISPGVAGELLKLTPADKIFRSENVLLYKLARVLERHGHAKVFGRFLVRNGRRQRAVSLELTEAGFNAIKGLDRRLIKDEF